MLRLGFVGCGKWARKLAESFRAVGAEIVAFDRRKPEFVRTDVRGLVPGEIRYDVAKTLDGFGRYQPWRDQLTSKDIDAIIAVAPPDVTTEVALACAAAGKPVMATKPLWDHPERITAPFYVDFWRLWGEAYQMSKGILAATTYDRTIVLKGAGPIREFPGDFDYGPHVMAMILDMARDGVALETRSHMRDGNRSLASAVFTLRMGHVLGNRMVRVEYGNAADVSLRVCDGVAETPTHIGTEPKDMVIQKMCRAFIADVQDGYVDTRLLRLSLDGMQLLRRIREEAK